MKTMYGRQFATMVGMVLLSFLMLGASFDAKDETITDVWIWAEGRSDGSYDLYIGYA